MIRLVILFLCSVAYAITDSEEDLDAFEDNLGIFLDKKDSVSMKPIKQGVFEEAAWIYQIKEDADYCEKICFARVLIPEIEGNYLEAYQLYLELDYKLSKLLKEKRKLDWPGLKKEIIDELQKIEDSARIIATANEAFEYFKEHGTYPEYDYDQDESEEEILATPEIPDSSSDKSSTTADKSSISSDSPEFPAQKRPCTEERSDTEKYSNKEELSDTGN